MNGASGIMGLFLLAITGALSSTAFGPWCFSTWRAQIRHPTQWQGRQDLTVWPRPGMMWISNTSVWHDPQWAAVQWWRAWGELWSVTMCQLSSVSSSAQRQWHGKPKACQCFHIVSCCRQISGSQLEPRLLVGYSRLFCSVMIWSDLSDFSISSIFFLHFLRLDIGPIWSYDICGLGTWNLQKTPSSKQHKVFLHAVQAGHYDPTVLPSVSPVGFSRFKSVQVGSNRFKSVSVFQWHLSDASLHFLARNVVLSWSWS